MMQIRISLSEKQLRELRDLPQPFTEIFISMIRDLENTREKYHGYSYVRTMRNILIGKEDAAIAPYFKNKDYYGMFDNLELKFVEILMDKLVEEKQLDIVFTEHGKLYCTHEYHDYLCRKKM